MSKNQANGEVAAKQPMPKKKKLTIIIASVTAVVLAALIGVGAWLAVDNLTVPKDMQYKVYEAKDNGKDQVKVGIISDVQLPQAEPGLHSWDLNTVMNGAHHLYKALKYYQSQNVDMILLNGDIVNASEGATFSMYNKVIDHVYAYTDENGKFVDANGNPSFDPVRNVDSMPHFVYPMGNHEFYGANQEVQYYKATGLPLNTRTVINGYSFIAIANSRHSAGDSEKAEALGVPDDGYYNEDRVNFLSKQLAAAESEHPGQPIFVFMHMPVDPSPVNGGIWATPNSKEIYDVLKNYPQVVLVTSHSHYSLADEHAIVQGDYTMVNTGTTSYFDFDWMSNDFMTQNELTEADLLAGKKLNPKKGEKDPLYGRDYMINPEYLGIYKGDDIPHRDEIAAGLMLTIDCTKNSFAIDKVNFNTGHTFGTSFSMEFGKKDTPINKDTFKTEKLTRTEKYIEEQYTTTHTELAPVFTAEHQDKISVVPDKFDPNSVMVSFNSVNSLLNGAAPMDVKYYQYELTYPDNNVVNIRFFATDFITGERGSIEQNRINLGYKQEGGIAPAGDYNLKVYAINSCGQKSKTYLKYDFTI